MKLRAALAVSICILAFCIGQRHEPINSGETRSSLNTASVFFDLSIRSVAQPIRGISQIPGEPSNSYRSDSSNDSTVLVEYPRAFYEKDRHDMIGGAIFWLGLIGLLAYFVIDRK